MKRLARYVRDHELWLMERILGYAKAQGYTKYTSTLIEAWRVSILGLSDALCKAVEVYGEGMPEFGPDERFDEDPVAGFGIAEARRHRERGVSLPMFLGLYKYYRYTFMDLVREMDADPLARQRYEAFVERCLDRIEIAFCTRWAGLDDDRAIAELQRANRLMTNEKNKYLTLFESLDSPVFLVDEKGNLDNVNVPAARLLGLPDSEGAIYYAREVDKDLKGAGKPLEGLLPWLGQGIGRFLTNNEMSFQIEVEAPGDTERRFLAAFSRMRDVSGKFSGGVVVLQDVTEVRRMERLKADVDRITRHDLKVPLSGILGVINFMLMDESLGKEQRRLLSTAKGSGYSMLDGINRSLDIFKMVMGTYRFEPESVDLGMVLGRLVDQFRALAEAGEVEISVDICGKAMAEHGSGPFLQAEELLLHSALGNLLANAIEASPEGGEVVVRIETGGDCRLTVANKGGVPPQIRETFFEKYATWGKKDGTGLGAYSARLIIETMRGSISMRSDDTATEITVRLPLAG